MDGPGGIRPDTLLWEQRKADYRFVDDLQKLRSTITGEGNLERFDYWLHVFRYLQAVGRFACSEGEMKRLTQKVEKLPEPDRADYWKQFVSLRKRQIAELTEVSAWLLKTVSTTGELGTVANWQQHVRDVSLEKPAQQIEKLMERSLPEECWPGDRLLDLRRMIVPTVRTAIRSGEDLRLKALFYGMQPRRVVVTWRRLGASSSETLEFEHATRGVYSVTIPAGKIAEDFEYAILAKANDGKEYRFPATAPAMNQTVVVY